MYLLFSKYKQAQTNQDMPISLNNGSPYYINHASPIVGSIQANVHMHIHFSRFLYVHAPHEHSFKLQLPLQGAPF